MYIATRGTSQEISKQNKLQKSTFAISPKLYPRGIKRENTLTLKDLTNLEEAVFVFINIFFY